MNYENEMDGKDRGRPVRDGFRADISARAACRMREALGERATERRTKTTGREAVAGILILKEHWIQRALLTVLEAMSFGPSSSAVPLSGGPLQLVEPGADFCWSARAAKPAARDALAPGGRIGGWQDTADQQAYPKRSDFLRCHGPMPARGAGGIRSRTGEAAVTADIPVPAVRISA